jgi:hypothetical protein
MAGLRRLILRSMATRRRFALIWGVCFWAGLTAICCLTFGPPGWSSGLEVAIVFAVCPIGGYAWGIAMWRYLNPRQPAPESNVVKLAMSKALWRVCDVMILIALGTWVAMKSSSIGLVLPGSVMQGLQMLHGSTIVGGVFLGGVLLVAAFFK